MPALLCLEQNVICLIEVDLDCFHCDNVQFSWAISFVSMEVVSRISETLSASIIRG
jgi:hypothetical protein